MLHLWRGLLWKTAKKKPLALLMLKTKLWKSIFGPIGTKDMRVQSDILGNLQTFLCSGVKIPCSKFQLWSLLFLKHICKPVNLQLSYYYFFFHVMGHKALLSLRGQRGQNYFNQKTNTLFFLFTLEIEDSSRFNWKCINFWLKTWFKSRQASIFQRVPMYCTNLWLNSCMSFFIK